MASSNSDRMNFLYKHVNELATRIREAGLEADYLEYLDKLQKEI